MKAIILAGGLGTRISEETHLKPKPMIEIGGRPILWHIMKLYSAHGVNDFADSKVKFNAGQSSKLRPCTPSKRYQHLQPEERMTIASLLHQHFTIFQIAQRLKRSSSTVRRELKRNIQDGCYASQVATTCARQRRRHGRHARKLHTEGILFGVVHHFLMQRWSPEQISLTLASTFPKGHELRVSTETIYNCIYAQTVRQLKKGLIQALPHARNKRVPRSKGQDRRRQIPDMLSIHLRPPHIEDRLFPGHWEGDLIKGAPNASAVGTLVERTSHLVMLVKLPQSKPASAANLL